MTVKQRALSMVAAIGGTVEVSRIAAASNPKQIEAMKEFGFDGKAYTEYEVFPPQGKVFQDGLTSLICFSWEDVAERLDGQKLQDEEEDVP